MLLVWEIWERPIAAAAQDVSAPDVSTGVPNVRAARQAMQPARILREDAKEGLRVAQNGGRYEL